MREYGDPSRTTSTAEVIDVAVRLKIVTPWCLRTKWLTLPLLSTARSSPCPRARCSLKPARRGIEVPAFCYYPPSLRRMRMCVVALKKCPAPDPAPAGRRGHDVTLKARNRAGPQAMLELVLANHPSIVRLRCRRRVRAAGHDLQVRRARIEIRRDQAAPRRAAVVPVVFFDRRAASSATAACASAAKVWMFGRSASEPRRRPSSRPTNRTTSSAKSGHVHRHLPVGALTPALIDIRPPWEMSHVVRLHPCGDGCKTTSGPAPTTA